MLVAFEELEVFGNCWRPVPCLFAQKIALSKKDQAYKYIIS